MIHILPDELVDRIAAGEVVERPSAVVKELVENALDAGAGQVDVHLEAGGRKLVKVTDDGEGISRDDLEKVYIRHATSKLSRLEDLFHIASLGFRGEALASIGAVSRMQITSRCRHGAEGACAANEGGRLLPVRPAGCPPGTTVEVKNLFYNVPARLNFLKTESTELSHCVNCVMRCALAFPDVGFTLLHNQRKVIRAEQNTTIQDRIARFFGKEVADGLIPIETEELGIRLSGFLGRPELGRHDLRRSFIFLNQRYISDRAVHAAIRRAYREVMPEKFQPVYFLHVGMPPDWVDVNVHPTKIEVRFLDGARVFSAVYKSIRNALAGNETCAAGLPPHGLNPSTGIRPSWIPAMPGPDPFFGEQAVAEGRGASAGARFDDPAGAGPRLSEKTPASHPDTGGLPGFGLHEQEEPIPLPERILQVHETYAVFETPDGLAIIDQHALHERVLFESLRREFECGGVRLQNLLLPSMLDLDPSQAARMNELCFDLSRLGIRAEPFGRDTLKITAVPALLKTIDPVTLTADILDRMMRGETGEQAYLDLLHRVACRGAVKAGHRLTAEELSALLITAGRIDFSGRCPHGRPTKVIFSKKDLEELFKRRGF
ncbi:MAG: DNA mismatch repair endonuclease MutL [Planctomycetota bacterium]